MKHSAYAVALAAIAMCSACTGIRKSGDQFTAHAESFNILGFQIPKDDYSSAMKQVPAGAEIHTVASVPSDWTSFFGGLNRIIGIGQTQISGKTR
jgi:hypothetical protein